MGAYLVVNSKEINSKSMSSFLGCILSDLIPREEYIKDKIYMNKTNICCVIKAILLLKNLSNKGGFEVYKETKGDCYWVGEITKEDYDEYLEYFLELFSDILCNMILENKRKIIIEWE